MKVVVAVDKFKGSLTAAEVGDHLRRGLTADRNDLEVVCVPIADGGDGTLAAALAAGYAPVSVEVRGPTGQAVHTQIAVYEHTAVVELATTCGLERLPEGRLAALTASTEGVGQAIAAALDAGCRTIVLGLGGSASTDAGAGILTALGARILTAEGTPVRPGGEGLASAVDLELTAAIDRLRGINLIIASDVDNPLTGRKGAAAVYGPQKGASADEVRVLDSALARFARLVADATGTDCSPLPGAGAAGGAGFAAYVLGGTFRPGIELILELVDLESHLDDADLVITGEGSLDEQSLNGKAPVGVAAAATRHSVPVVAVAGQVSVDPERLRENGIRRTYALTDLNPDVDECIASAGPLLQQLAQQVIAIHEAGEPIS
ncbi:glycerate kinase [Demetria terragena]|uniref:glycerate kinase n=1 Tax=Demetria terragena TaxID=63959 RepID=UPI0003764DDE|nr:glycerate kinase [Demetria terragena]